MEPDQVVQTLRTWRRVPAGRLRELLQVSRATLMRAIRAAGTQVIARGSARRTSYSARRSLRGSIEPLALFQVDAQGGSREVGRLDLTYPQGCAVDFLAPFDWPLDADMRDGWFEGLPYPLEDMRPQGYLGRQFARAHALMLQVGEDPTTWSEDDALHALTLLGLDQSGNYIVGEAAYRQWLDQLHRPLDALTESQARAAYPRLADESMQLGRAGSSAAGEFPKFTAVRNIDGRIAHVIVKFSGSDVSPGTQRWSDLLVCEQLASAVMASHLQIAAAPSRVVRTGGRTFLEVERFDRHGLHGRSGLCSWSSVNAALFGLAGRPWTEGAKRLLSAGLIDAANHDAIARQWHFGQLIANTDMHDGNLSFRPGLQVAPAYDMLPMLYAPQRGVEVPERPFAPRLPLPAEREAWHASAAAAIQFWEQAASDARISGEFRELCKRNAQAVYQLAASSAAGVQTGP